MEEINIYETRNFMIFSVSELPNIDFRTYSKINVYTTITGWTLKTIIRAI